MYGFFTVLQFDVMVKPLLTWNFLRDLRKHTRNRHLGNRLEANSNPRQLSTLRSMVECHKSTAAGGETLVIILYNCCKISNRTLKISQ